MIAGAILLLSAAMLTPYVVAIFLGDRTVAPWANRIILWGLVLACLTLGILFFRRRESRTLLPTLIISGLATLLALGAAEVLLRAIAPALKSPDLQMIRINPHGTGSFRLRPDLDFSTRYRGKTIRMKTNSVGMRGKEVQREPSPGRRRVAFAGDSFTFGCWATTEESTFVGVVDRLLGTKNLEVLNFGVPGYGFADIELLLREEILSFKPQVLVLASFNGNDFLDTYLGLERYDLSAVENGYYKENPEPILRRIPEAYRPDRPNRLSVSNLALYQAYRNAADRFLPDVIPSTFAINRSGLCTSYSFWSQWPYPDIAARIKDDSLQVLDRIVAICRRNNIRLVLIAIPYVDQVYAPAVSGDGFDYRFPQTFVEEFALARSVPYLDLAVELRKRVGGLKESLYFGTDVHFGDFGHRIVGEIIAQFLLEQSR